MLHLAIVILLILVLWWFLVATKHPKDFPPGPRMPLPLVGDALAIGKNLPEGFDQLRKRYGNIFGLYVGNTRAVVVSDLDLIHEVGSNLAFSSRPELPISELRGGLVKSGSGYSTGGLAGSSGPTWVEQRRFALHTLRNLGFGKKSMEGMIAEEVGELLRYWEACRGEAVEPHVGLSMSLLNSLWSIVSRERKDYNDAKIQELVHLMAVFFREAVDPLNAMFFMYKPLCLLAEATNVVSGPTTLRKMAEFTAREISLHEATFQEDNLRDFTDHYLKEMKDKSNVEGESSFKGDDGKVNLMNTLLDFFIAGGETSATTLNWALYYMVLHPDVQEKVQIELDQVTSRSRLPQLSDRIETPFTEAVILEAQRCGNIFPLSVTHAAAKDTYLGPYFIPRGTSVYQNLSSVHGDPDIFPDPDKFDPTRYISKAGKFEAHPLVMPFGLGKRRCIGESLAKMSLYLYFSAVLSAFTLVPETEFSRLPTERVFGITVSPAPYKIRFIPRK